MKNGKRILKVTLKKMIDESPDTSWLGEYSNRATSEFSIDRAHAEDCQSVNPRNAEALQAIENAMDHLTAHTYGPMDDAAITAATDAQDLLTTAQDEVQECDCNGGDMGRNEYQFFNPSFNYVDKDGNALKENTPEEVRKYTRQDYERMESLNAGQWCYLGIRADAEIQLTKDGPLQDVTSGGLWGVESDAGRADMEETEQEQMHELRGQLLALGFSRRAIASAFKNVEHKDA
jgi:hypothetical protein